MSQPIIKMEGKKKVDKEQSGDMGSRGVTRPMMGGDKMNHDQKAKDDGQKDQDGGHNMKMDDMKMSDDMRVNMLHQHHKQTLWVYWTVVLLGFWMVAFPLTFDYGVGAVQPSGGRSLWLTLDQRILFIKWSDILSGLGLIYFGWRSLTPTRPVSVWIACFIGIWLSMAPMVWKRDFRRFRAWWLTRVFPRMLVPDRYRSGDPVEGSHTCVASHFFGTSDGLHLVAGRPEACSLGYRLA